MHSSHVIMVAECLLPQYHIFTFVLAMISLASFLKLNYIVKTVILLVMVVVYTALMLAAFPSIFAKFQVNFILQNSCLSIHSLLYSFYF